MPSRGGFVWLVSYPKSGNTWLRLALHSLLKGGAPVSFAIPFQFAPLVGDITQLEAVLDVEASELTAAELEEWLPDCLMLSAADAMDMQFRKVHDHWARTPSGRQRFPTAATRAAIYLVRDPRDVAVSWAHHSNIGIDEAIDFMADIDAVLDRGGKGVRTRSLPQPLSSWSRHVESWLNADPAPLTLRYEDMLADPFSSLTRVAEHCGISADAAAMERAVAATRFDHLVNEETAHGFHIGQVPGRRFFRRGKAGGWRDSLSAAQAERIRRDHGAIMARFNYD